VHQRNPTPRGIRRTDLANSKILRGDVQRELWAVQEAGFMTASVVGPFGNSLGLRHSPHDATISDERKRS
jgi:hypothetical protein